MNEEKMRQSFTVVFEGDVTKLGFNPFKAESVFGRVQAVAMGDLMEECGELCEALEGTQDE